MREFNRFWERISRMCRSNFASDTICWCFLHNCIGYVGDMREQHKISWISAAYIGNLNFLTVSGQVVVIFWINQKFSKNTIIIKCSYVIVDNKSSSITAWQCTLTPLSQYYQKSLEITSFTSSPPDVAWSTGEILDHEQLCYCFNFS